MCQCEHDKKSNTAAIEEPSNWPTLIEGAGFFSMCVVLYYVAWFICSTAVEMQPKPKPVILGRPATAGP